MPVRWAPRQKGITRHNSVAEMLWETSTRQLPVKRSHMTPKEGVQIYIRISICLQRVFCLEGQCALNHLPQMFVQQFKERCMREKKTSRPICFALSSPLLIWSYSSPFQSQNNNTDVSKPFCSLPTCPIFRRVWTRIKILYFPHPSVFKC